MKKLIVLLLSCLGIAAYAQNTNSLDSLLNEASRPHPDSVQLSIHNNIGFQYQYSSPAKAINHFEKVVSLSQKNKWPLKEANAWYDLGFCYMLLATYDKSLENYLKAARLYEQLNDKKRLFNTYMSVGNVYFNNDDIARANTYYSQSISIASVLKDSMMMANVYTAFGNAFDKQKKYDSALMYLQKANYIFTRRGDVYDRINILSNLGLTYKHSQKLNEAIAHMEQVKKIVDENKLDVDLVAQVYNNLAATYAQAKQFTKARAAFDSSILYSNRANLSQILMENYHNLSDMYAQMNNPVQELHYLRQYYQLKDSLFNSDKKNELTRLEADYQLEKKNSELAKKDAEVARNNAQKNILLIIIIAAALLLAALSYFYSRIKKQHKQLSTQNITIQQQNEELHTLNNVKDRLFSIISHDLRNPLVTLQSYLTLSGQQHIDQQKKDAMRQQTINAVSQTSNMLDNLLAWANMQIRNTKANITLVDVDDLVADTSGGAKPQADQKQIIIHQNLAITSIPGDYHILTIALRNLLTNAIKFSDAQGNIWIDAQKTGKEFLLSVKDEGIGMTPAQVQELQQQQQQTVTGTAGEKGSGLGLYLVTELLHKMNARLEVNSQQGKGSTFSIVIAG